MAHFAEIDENNIVLRVTVVANEVLLDENGIEQENLGLKHLEHLGGRWVQTSYNNNIRTRYAGVGMIYRENLDAFIYPQPYPSWTLNEITFEWEPPIPYPVFDEENPKYYRWNEDILNWEEIQESE
jgi:hypothetical protein